MNKEELIKTEEKLISQIENFNKKHLPITVLNTTDGPVELNIKTEEIKLPEMKKFRPLIEDDYLRVIKKMKDCSLQSMLDFEFIFSKNFGKLPEIDVSSFTVTYRKGHKIKTNK